MRRAVAEMETAGLLGDCAGRDRRRARGVPLRRGEGAARGHRGQRAAAPLVAAVPARPVRHRTAARLGGARPRERAMTGATSRTRHWSTTSRRSPTSPTSCAKGPEWFRRWAPSRRARWCAPWSATSAARRRRGRAGHAAARGARPPAAGARRAARQGGVLRASANPVLTAAQLDTPFSYEAFEAAGSGLGAAGFIVYDDTACMVEVAAMFSRFLSVESCGQCPPCKLGTGEITAALDRIATGERHERRPRRHPDRLPDRRRRQPLLPARRGAADHRQHPARLPRRLRRPPRRALSPAPRRSRSPRSSTSPTARSSTTNARRTSGRTGPTTTKRGDARP